ncbi:translation initiation factor IF-1 [Candidatus Vidania fulgoroideorum]
MNNNLILEGEIIKNLPNATFLVYFKKIKREIVCYISGKIRINYIRILPGDIVKVEINKFYSNKGRIIYRLK